ncbi:hypothetical protein [Clostridium sp. KNHs214]|uniref:hypothetical protein n=1 Tax=Clostridium sp. KNHs214 TaxID=1540257 RepID=UPI00068F81D9|nr:hypothetical protein [Clostridium sp. KNHs214]
MENIENNKMYQAIVELRTKGSLQEQAKELRELEKLYKNLWYETENEIYKNKLDNVRLEMCELNSKVQEHIKVFDELIEIQAMDVEVFLNTFDMKWEEWDENEDCYNNLLGSNTDIGHCLRTALIHSEKLIKEMM